MQFKTDEKRRQRRKDYYQKNKEKEKSLMKEWRKANPDRHRKAAKRSHFKKMYGLTEEQVESLLVQANYCCQVCGRKEDLNIDHCHATGCVRGILCGSCNRALGLLQDSPEVITSLLTYITPLRPTGQAPRS